MKFLAIILTTISATVFAIGAPDDAALVAKEKAIWNAAQHKRLDQFQQLVAPNVRAVFADGIMAMADQLKAIPKRTMKSVRFGNFNVVFPGPSIATAIAEAVTAGKETNATYNCGSVWQTQHGQWQAMFHGEAGVARALATPSH